MFDILKKSTIPIIIFLVVVISCYYYWDGAKTLIFQSILYIILVFLIVLFSFRRAYNFTDKLAYFACAIAVFGLFLPNLIEKDSQIKQVKATNIYNCYLAVKTTNDILYEFATTNVYESFTTYVTEPYLTNLGSLVYRDASTTIGLIGKLDSQNRLIAKRNEIVVNGYQLLTDPNFMRKADVEEQEISNLDYGFIESASKIIDDIKSLQTTIAGDSIAGCAMPQLPNPMCAKGSTNHCWSN